MTSVPKVENKYNKLIELLQVDRGSEFIFAKFENFCEKKNLKIKYVILYMNIKNDKAKHE